MVAPFVSGDAFLAHAGKLGQQLATWVAHDLGHIGQVVRVMARQYSTAVGPWRAYLSILGRGQTV